MADRFFENSNLRQFAYELLTSAGMEPAKAEVVAELLIQTDEMGVTTHGISMVPYYLPELQSGNMANSGTYEIIKDTGATMVWDGNKQPGLWLMPEAIAVCVERAREHGIATAAIRRSHHIGCLSTLLRLATDEGFVCIITTSDPAGRCVAPYGGSEPTLTPNPWAVGYPTDGDPVLIDICASITTVSKVREYVNGGKVFEDPWMLDGHGVVSNDPNVVNEDPMGTILPLGGMDHGHKGYGMALMIEMLTQALSGYGRADGPTGWGASVFLQVMDPDAFGGGEAFREQVAHLNALCRGNKPAKGFDQVRIPGDRAFASIGETIREGIPLSDEIWTRLEEWAERLKVEMPWPI